MTVTGAVIVSIFPGASDARRWSFGALERINRNLKDLYLRSWVMTQEARRELTWESMRYRYGLSEISDHVSHHSLFLLYIRSRNPIDMLDSAGATVRNPEIALPSAPLGNCGSSRVTLTAD